MTYRGANMKVFIKTHFFQNIPPKKEKKIHEGFNSTADLQMDEKWD